MNKASSIITRNYKSAYAELFKEALAESPKGFYDEVGLPAYTHKNRLMSWLFWKRIEVALSMLEDIERKSVLDFGCGGGVTFKYLAERNARITGCDTHAYELATRVCQKLGINANLHRDLFQINSQTFDYILALDVLEHVEEPDPIIEKVVELSDPQTRIILSGPTESAIYKAGRLLAGFSGHYRACPINPLPAGRVKR